MRSSKFTPEVIERINLLREAGKSIREISDMIGVNVTRLRTQLRAIQEGFSSAMKRDLSLALEKGFRDYAEFRAYYDRLSVLKSMFRVFREKIEPTGFEVKKVSYLPKRLEGIEVIFSDDEVLEIGDGRSFVEGSFEEHLGMYLDRVEYGRNNEFSFSYEPPRLMIGSRNIEGAAILGAYREVLKKEI